MPITSPRAGASRAARTSACSTAAVNQPLWQELDASLCGRLAALTLHNLLQRASATGLR